MNHYKFPAITHIDQVKLAIAGKPEFIIAEREHYDVVNYLVVMPDTFSGENSDILRECRGLIFNKEGEVLSRRLHKFFNVNEKEETQVHEIDLSKPHVILEKLDGSMITPIRINGKIRWGTKMGITDISMKVEEWVIDHPGYELLADFCSGVWTPIFEWCSRKQKIVIDHPEDRLVLIAIRDNVTGHYCDYQTLVEYGEKCGVEVVKAFENTHKGLQEFLDYTGALEQTEGFVIRFDDGHMLKVKSGWYVQLHKTKDALKFEKNVVSVLVNNQADDIKAFMLPEDRAMFEEKEALFWKEIQTGASFLRAFLMDMYRQNKGDRKAFAMGDANKWPQYIRSIMFTLWDKEHTVGNVRAEMLKVIQKNCGTQKNIDRVRMFWHDHNMAIWSEA